MYKLKSMLLIALVAIAIGEQLNATLHRSKRKPSTEYDYIEDSENEVLTNHGRSLPVRIQRHAFDNAAEDIDQMSDPTENVFRKLVQKSDYIHGQTVDKRHADKQNRDPFEKLKGFFDELKKRSIDENENDEDSDDVPDMRASSDVEETSKETSNANTEEDNQEESGSSDAESESGESGDESGDAESGSGETEDIAKSNIMSSPDNYDTLFKSKRSIDDDNDEDTIGLKKKREVGEDGNPQFEGIPERLAIVSRENPRVKILRREAKDKNIPDIPLPFNRMISEHDAGNLLDGEVKIVKRREIENVKVVRSAPVIKNQIFTKLVPYKEFKSLEIFKRALGKEEFKNLRIIDEEKAKSLFDDEEGDLIKHINQDGIYYDTRNRRFLITAKEDNLNNVKSEAPTKKFKRSGGTDTESALGTNTSTVKSIEVKNKTTVEQTGIKVSRPSPDKRNLKDVKNSINHDVPGPVIVADPSKHSSENFKNTATNVDAGKNRTALHPKNVSALDHQEVKKHEISPETKNIFLHIFKTARQGHVHSTQSSRISKREIFSDSDPGIDVLMGFEGKELEEDKRKKRTSQEDNVKKAESVYKFARSVMELVDDHKTKSIKLYEDKSKPLIGVWSGLGTAPEFVPGLIKRDYVEKKVHKNSTLHLMNTKSKNGEVFKSKISQKRNVLTDAQKRKRSAVSSNAITNNGEVKQKAKTERKNGIWTGEYGFPIFKFKDETTMRKNPTKRATNGKSDDPDEDEDTKETDEELPLLSKRDIIPTDDDDNDIEEDSSGENNVKEKKATKIEKRAIEQTEAKQMELGSLGALNMTPRNSKHDVEKSNIPLGNKRPTKGNKTKRADTETETEINHMTDPVQDGKVVLAFDEVKELLPTKHFFSKDEEQILDPPTATESRNTIPTPNAFDVDKELAESMVLTGDARSFIPHSSLRATNVEYEPNSANNIRDDKTGYERSGLNKEPPLLKTEKKLRQAQLAQYKAEEVQPKYEEMKQWAQNNKETYQENPKALETEKKIQVVSDQLAESNAELEKLKMLNNAESNSAYLAKMLQDKDNSQEGTHEEREEKSRQLQQQIFQEQASYRKLIDEQHQQYLEKLEKEEELRRNEENSQTTENGNRVTSPKLKINNSIINNPTNERNENSFSKSSQGIGDYQNETLTYPQTLEHFERVHGGVEEKQVTDNETTEGTTTMAPETLEHSERIKSESKESEMTLINGTSNNKTTMPLPTLITTTLESRVVTAPIQIQTTKSTTTTTLAPTTTTTTTTTPPPTTSTTSTTTIQNSTTTTVSSTTLSTTTIPVVTSPIVPLTTTNKSKFLINVTSGNDDIVSSEHQLTIENKKINHVQSAAGISTDNSISDNRDNLNNTLMTSDVNKENERLHKNKKGTGQPNSKLHNQSAAKPFPFPLEMTYQPRVVERNNTQNKKLEIEPRSDGYIGCFIDHLVEGRDLPVRAGIPFVTPANCRSACKKTGYKYAGIQYGYLCFCGNTYGKYDIVPDSECNTVCSGNDSFSCGGLWRNEVFATEHAKEIDYKGPVSFDPSRKGSLTERSGTIKSNIPSAATSYDERIHAGEDLLKSVQNSEVLDLKTLEDEKEEAISRSNIDVVRHVGNFTDEDLINAASLELKVDNAAEIDVGKLNHGPDLNPVPEATTESPMTDSDDHKGEVFENFVYLHPQSNDEEEPMKSPVLPLRLEPGTHLFRGEIMLKQPWYDDLSKPESTKFQILTGNIEEALKNIFISDTSFLKAEVMSLREGSRRTPHKTIADFTLTFLQNETTATVTHKLFNSVMSTKMLDEMPVLPHSLKVKEYLLDANAQAYIPTVVNGELHLDTTAPIELRYNADNKLVIPDSYSTKASSFANVIQPQNVQSTNQLDISALTAKKILQNTLPSHNLLPITGSAAVHLQQPGINQLGSNSAPLNPSVQTHVRPVVTDGMKELHNYMAAQSSNENAIQRGIISKPSRVKQQGQQEQVKKRKVPYVLRMFFWKDMLARKKRENVFDELQKKESMKQKVIHFTNDLPIIRARREDINELSSDELPIIRGRREQADEWPITYKTDDQKQGYNKKSITRLKRKKRVLPEKMINENEQKDDEIDSDLAKVFNSTFKRVTRSNDEHIVKKELVSDVLIEGPDKTQDVVERELHRSKRNFNYERDSINKKHVQKRLNK